MRRRHLILVCAVAFAALAATAAAALTAPEVFDFNGSSTPAPPTGATLHVVQADGVKNALVLDTFGNGQQGVFLCRTAQGTGAEPEALPGNNLMCSMQAWGYDGTSYGPRPAGSVAIRAAGSFTSTSHPTWFKVEVTPRGTTNNIIPLVVTPEGHWAHTGPTPTIDCGSGDSVIGDDNGGRITVGTAALSCTLTFANEWQRTDASVTEVPGCTVQDETAAVLLVPQPTSTELAIVGAIVGGDKLVYDCRQLRN